MNGQCFRPFRVVVAAVLAGAAFSEPQFFHEGGFSPILIGDARADDDDGPVDRDDDGPGDDERSDDDRLDDDDGKSGDDDRDDDDDRGVPPRLAADEELDDANNPVRRRELILIGPTARSIEAARRLGFKEVRRIDLPALNLVAVVLRVPARTSAVDGLRRLRRADPGSIYDFNHIYGFRPTIGSSPVPRFEPKKRLRQALSQRNDITIGLIDTEVDARHPTLRGAWLKHRDFMPSRGALPEHGTAVASLLLDQRDGLVPRGRLFVASIFEDSVRGNAVGSVGELVQALDWLAAEGVSVVNMSLAGPPNELLRAAVERTIARGHVIVAAVGNDGPNARPLYPASYAGVLGVTAIDKQGRIYRRAAQGSQVDFAAPGVDVPLAHPKGYGLYTGTSFAAPYATAVVAVGLRRFDPLEARLWLDQLAKRAIDLGPKGRDSVYGHGLISLQPRQ